MVVKPDIKTPVTAGKRKLEVTSPSPTKTQSQEPTVKKKKVESSSKPDKKAQVKAGKRKLEVTSPSLAKIQSQEPFGKKKNVESSLSERNTRLRSRRKRSTKKAKTDDVSCKESSLAYLTKKAKKEDMSCKESSLAYQTKKSCKESSLAYLHEWNTDRGNWKFQKLRQTWLLKHMLDSTMMSNEDFKVMLSYIEDIKGAARERTRSDAEKAVEGSYIEGDAVLVSRAREVVQVLA